MSQALAIINATREAARIALRDQAIEMARQTAKQLAGVVVTSEAESGHVTDLLSEVKRGQKAAKAALDGVCDLHRKAIDAARGEFEEITAALATAEKGGKDALNAWIEQKEREAREARRAAAKAEAERVERQRREAQEDLRRLEAERMNAIADGDGEVVAETSGAISEIKMAIAAPPMEDWTPEPVAQTRGSKGFAHRNRTLCVEMVDAVEAASFDAGFVTLNEPLAKARFREYGGPMEADEERTWHGMRFWFKRGISAR